MYKLYAFHPFLVNLKNFWRLHVQPSCTANSAVHGCNSRLPVWTLWCHCRVKHSAYYQPFIIVCYSFYFWLIRSFTNLCKQATFSFAVLCIIMFKIMVAEYSFGSLWVLYVILQILARERLCSIDVWLGFLQLTMPDLYKEASEKQGVDQGYLCCSAEVTKISPICK